MAPTPAAAAPPPSAPAPDRTPIPGRLLLGVWPGLAAALILINDLLLKPHWPGRLSGKLSDLGLAFFVPLVAAAGLQWGSWLLARVRRRPWTGPSAWQDTLAWVLAGTYFTALKLSPAAAEAHVALLSGMFGRRGFAAVADPTDLVALPLVLLAAWYLRRQRPAGPGEGGGPARRPAPPNEARRTRD